MTTKIRETATDVYARLAGAACARCVYFVALDSPTFSGHGACRRYPPTIHADMVEVRPAHWCGEYVGRHGEETRP